VFLIKMIGHAVVILLPLVPTHVCFQQSEWVGVGLPVGADNPSYHLRIALEAFRTHEGSQHGSHLARYLAVQGICWVPGTYFSCHGLRGGGTGRTDAIIIVTLRPNCVCWRNNVQGQKQGQKTPEAVI
jgi:hypothetical protein